MRAHVSNCGCAAGEALEQQLNPCLGVQMRHQVKRGDAGSLRVTAVDRGRHAQVLRHAAPSAPRGLQHCACKLHARQRAAFSGAMAAENSRLLVL